jgi:gliding motility-associated-like protein
MRIILASFFFLIITFAPHFTNGQFITKGDANQLSDNCFQITKDEGWRYGIIWWKNKIDLSKPLELQFVLYLGTKDQNGADGIAFLFHNDPAGFDAKGATAGGLGFGYSDEEPNSRVIKPSVAIEFDTYQNKLPSGDVIPDDHTTVVYNGNVGQPLFRPIRINPDNPNVEDNRCHHYRITWDPATKDLKLYFDGKLRFSHRDDLVSKVFNGNPIVYYGFTGSTGGLYNEQTVCIFQPDSKPMPQDDTAQTASAQPVGVPVLENDTHSTGDPLTLTRIGRQPANGTAVISGDQVIYTPQPGFAGTDTFTYEVCETTSSACYSKCETATVTVKVECSPLVTPPKEFLLLCPGTTVTLTANPGDLYEWSTGETKQSITLEKGGLYWVKVKSRYGCELYLQETLVTEGIKPPDPLATGDSRCGPGSLLLTATGGNEGDYRWYTSATADAPLQNITRSRFETPTLRSSTTYYVSIFQNGCESARIPVQAVVIPYPAANIVQNLTLLVGQSYRLQAPKAAGVVYRWSPSDGLDDPTSDSPAFRSDSPLETVYTLTVTNEGGCESSAQVKIKVTEDLRIPNAFSPNGDGVNDTWEIANVLNFPQARIEVFDRWGSRIFDTTGYKNDWSGIWRGNPLPTGTYFYLITVDQGRRLTGSVTILRHNGNYP